MTETWKPATGWEGLYEVSDAGRVRNCARRLGTRPGKVLAIGSCRGYAQVKLYRSGRGRTEKLHHLVLLAFVGPRPPGADGLHGDGDRKNNTPGNLRWGTRQENERDKDSHGRRARGAAAAGAKLTDAAARELISRRDLTTRKAAQLFGVSCALVSMIRTGARWGHLQVTPS